MNDDKPEIPKTVKCRIALAVDPKGAWRADGWGSATGASGGIHLLDELPECAACYWIEVEVPVPTVPTIRAEAKEVQP